MLKLQNGGFLKLETELRKDIGEEVILSFKIFLSKLDKLIKQNEKNLSNTSANGEGTAGNPRERSDL